MATESQCSYTRPTSSTCSSTVSYPSTMPWGYHSSAPLVTQGKGDSKVTEPAGTRKAAALQLEAAEETLRRSAAARPRQPVLWQTAGTPQAPANRPPRPNDLAARSRERASEGWGGPRRAKGTAHLRPSHSKRLPGRNPGAHPNEARGGLNFPSANTTMGRAHGPPPPRSNLSTAGSGAAWKRGFRPLLAEPCVTCPRSPRKTSAARVRLRRRPFCVRAR